MLWSASKLRQLVRFTLLEMYMLSFYIYEYLNCNKSIAAELIFERCESYLFFRINQGYRDRYRDRPLVDLEVNN